MIRSSDVRTDLMARPSRRSLRADRLERADERGLFAIYDSLDPVHLARTVHEVFRDRYGPKPHLRDTAVAGDVDVMTLAAIPHVDE